MPHEHDAERADGAVFQIVTEYPPGGLSIDPAYLGVARSPEAVIIQVMLNVGRDADIKQKFYQALANGLHDRVGLRREDVLINLVEVRENCSFGNRQAQFIEHDSGTGPAPAAGTTKEATS